MRKAAQKNAVAGVGFDESLTRLGTLVEEMERGELTNTLKLRRAVVAENYREVIDRMYEE